MTDLYQQEALENLSNYDGTTRPDGTFFGNDVPAFAKGTMEKITQGAVGLGKIVGGAGAAAIDRYGDGGTETQDKFFKSFDDNASRYPEFWTPDPADVTMASEVASELAALLPQIFANPAAAVAMLQARTSEEMAQQGVDPLKATAVGTIEGVSTGVGFFVPMLGKTAAQRMLVGGVGFNVAQGVGTRAVQQQFIDDPDLRKQFAPLDPTLIALDAMLGLAFGAFAEFSPEARQQGADVQQMIEDWVARLKPSDKDAIATLRQAYHMREESLPGKPAGPADVNKHVDNVRKTIKALEDGRLPDADELQEPQFEPDPERDAQREELAIRARETAREVMLEEGEIEQVNPYRPLDIAEVAKLMPDEQADAIARGVEDRLVEAGLEPEEARTNAVIWKAFVQAKANEYGVTPAEVMTDYGLDIKRGRDGARPQQDQTVLYQQNEQWYYSQLRREVDTANIKQAPAAGWKQYFKGRIGKGLKPDELEFTGINEWLELQEGKVTKEQVQAFLEQNGVQVEEVALGAPQGKEAKDRIDQIYARLSNIPYEIELSRNKFEEGPNTPERHFQHRSEISDLTAERDALSDEMKRMFGGETKHSQWQEPGGKEYREFVFTIPADDYESTHYPGIKGYIGHVRANERIDANGKRVWFIEEFQSDRGQKGRKEGFVVKETDQGGAPPGWGNTETSTGVPSAPFVGKTDAWVGLLMKRMIRYAAENGFDRVAWTNGEQQADRYNLSKHLSEVSAAKMEGDRYMIVAKDLGGIEVISKSFPANKLPDAVGKDLADKIVKQEKAQTYSGLDLKVGGEGMKAFYDRIVPKVANELLKRMGGGKVADVVFTTDTTGSLYDRARPESVAMDASGRWNIRLADGTEVGIWRSETDAQRALVQQQERFDAGNPTTQQPGFDITPEMRNAAMKGQPLFQDKKGRITFGEGRTLIELLETADKSTFMHETAHAFLQITRDMATRIDAPERAMADWAIIANWLGSESAEPGPITRAQHEQFAEGFETYLAEGIAPTPELQGAFARFKDWLLDIYQSVTGMRVQLNADVRAVFDRMLTPGDQPSSAAPAEPGPATPPPVAALGRPASAEGQRHGIESADVQDFLKNVEQDFGYATKGGRVVRDPDSGEVTGRTSWEPYVEWWPARPKGISEAGARETMRKHRAGETLRVPEQRFLDFLVDIANEHITAANEHMAAAKAIDNETVLAELRASDLEETPQNIEDATLVARAAAINEDALERVALQFADDDAGFMDAVRRIAGERSNTETAETRQDNQGESRAEEPVDPLEATARRAVDADPDRLITVPDENGNSIKVKARDYLDDADEQYALAQQDTELFRIAAECLLGGGR